MIPCPSCFHKCPVCFGKGYQKKKLLEKFYLSVLFVFRYKTISFFSSLNFKTNSRKNSFFFSVVSLMDNFINNFPTVFSFSYSSKIKTGILAISSKNSVSDLLVVVLLCDLIILEISGFLFF